MIGDTVGDVVDDMGDCNIDEVIDVHVNEGGTVVVGTVIKICIPSKNIFLRKFRLKFINFFYFGPRPGSKTMFL